MKKYFVLYKASPEQFKKWMSMTPDEQKKGMEVWNAWMEAHKADIAEPWQPLSKVKRVTPKEIKDVNNDIGGYVVVHAGSLDAAAKLMQDSPHFEELENGSWIEVMEMPEWKL